MAIIPLEIDPDIDDLRTRFSATRIRLLEIEDQMQNEPTPAQVRRGVEDLARASLLLLRVVRKVALRPN